MLSIMILLLTIQSSNIPTSSSNLKGIYLPSSYTQSKREGKSTTVAFKFLKWNTSSFSNYYIQSTKLLQVNTLKSWGFLYDLYSINYLQKR